MGLVYAEITLRNAGDGVCVDRGIMKEPEIREVTVTAMVDTGAATIVINEALRQQLGLMLQDDYRARLADGSKQKYSYADAVEIHWKNRKSVLRPIVVPNATEVLLGALPLEEMDLIISPAKQELIGAHGDEPLHRI